MVLEFMLVDDDEINNIYNRMIIEMGIPHCKIITFTQPEEALSHLRMYYRGPDFSETILFLDINMPQLSGWEFLEVFEAFSVDIRKQVKIFMVSSSVDPRDKVRALNCRDVLGFIEKPLTEESLELVLTKLGNPSEESRA